MASNLDTSKGFFETLFDWNFDSFLTLKFLKVIYVALTILIVLAGVVFLISGFTKGVAAGIASLILVPIGVLIYLIGARIYLELIALFFRVGENTSAIRAALERNNGSSAPGSGL